MTVNAQDMVNIGELMEIKIEDKAYKTKLQDLFEDGRFTVFHPTVKGLPIMLEMQEKYTLRFYRPNGIFSFEAQLLNWYTKENIRLCLFQPETEVVKSQRRQSFRLPIVLDVVLRLDDETGEQPPQTFKGRTVDISEHGMLLTCYTSLDMDSQTTVELKLSPVETMTLRGKVLRCEKPSDKKDPFRIVLLFVGSSDRQRSALGRYILRQQIIARKKKNQEVMP